MSFSDDIRGYGVGHADTEAPVAKVSVPHLVALLLDLSADSEGIIRQVLDSGDLGLKDKGGRDDVTGAYVQDAQTEADRRIERHILSALREFCPTLPVVGEESHEGQLDVMSENDVVLVRADRVHRASHRRRRRRRGPATHPVARAYPRARR